VCIGLKSRELCIPDVVLKRECSNEVIQVLPRQEPEIDEKADILLTPLDNVN
jgi:hypothetical protein